MFFINELKPTLNVQSDSIRAKVFNELFTSFFFVCFYCLFTPAKKKKKKIFKILLTCIPIYLYLPLYFYYLLDNDRSTVETSCFTVDFYR